MITEEIMLKRFYQQNPDYIGKDIEIINDRVSYSVNKIDLYLSDKVEAKIRKMSTNYISGSTCMHNSGFSFKDY